MPHLADLWLHLEDGEARPFHRVNHHGLRIKGGSGTLLPLDDGGYLGVIVGIRGPVDSQDEIPLTPPTSIGLARFNAEATLEGSLTWVAEMADTYLSYPQIAPLGEGRYLLGYGEMKRLGDSRDNTDVSYRIPWNFYLTEIDATGGALSSVQRLDGVGWGEQDQMVSLGRGRVAWAYVPDPVLIGPEERPPCNSQELQLSVYVPD